MQQIIDSKNGDCLKCCVASLLELPYEKVPNFVEGRDWLFELRKFLEVYNMYPLYLQRSDPLYQKVNYIATGKTVMRKVSTAVSAKSASTARCFIR